MIQKTSQKIGTLLLTCQKKKLFYNRRAQSDLFIPFEILCKFLTFMQLIIQLRVKTTKRGFLVIGLALILIAMTEIHTISSLFLIKNSPSFIYSQEQSINIETFKIQDHTFYEFKQKYQKKYLNSQEEVFRSIVFIKNKEEIHEHNSRMNRKFNMAINFFADLTPKQFSEIYTTLYKSDNHIKNYSKNLINQQKDSKSFNSQSQFNQFFQSDKYIETFVIAQIQNKNNYIKNQNQNFHILDSILTNSIHKFSFSNTGNSSPLKQSLSNVASVSMALNNSLNLTKGNFSLNVIDWTLHAGKIRYQGICGACYTFSTSDVVASLYSIYKFGFFVPLSTQQVIDCSTNGLTYGCNGGFLEGSFSYMQMKGIQTDVNYPYTSAVSGIQGLCKKEGGPFKITSFQNVQEGDCRALVNQLNYGPVSIGIAGYRLQFYQDGIFNDCNSYVDHAVMLIGYKGGLGWKIKNSWGPEWGMKGFAWIEDGNNCGICNMAVAAKL